MNRASEQGVVKSNLLGYLPFKAQKKMGWGGWAENSIGRSSGGRLPELDEKHPPRVPSTQQRQAIEDREEESHWVLPTELPKSEERRKSETKKGEAEALRVGKGSLPGHRGSGRKNSTDANRSY